MRTTLEIDDEVLAAARDLARLEDTTLGAAVSRLARDGLRTRAVVNHGRIPVFAPRPGAAPITSEVVAAALDDA